MTFSVRPVGPHVALITAAATSLPTTTVEPEPWLEAMRSLGDGVGWIVMAATEPDDGTLDRLLAHGRPLATGVRSVDALKLVTETMVVQTIDRRRVYAASLPAVVERSHGETALSAAGGVVSVADLVAPGEQQILLVDGAGRQIGDSII